MLDVRVRTEKNTKAQGEEESKRETKREKEVQCNNSHARVVVYINCAAATTVGMWACM